MSTQSLSGVTAVGLDEDFSIGPTTVASAPFSLACVEHQNSCCYTQKAGRATPPAPPPVLRRTRRTLKVVVNSATSPDQSSSVNTSSSTVVTPLSKFLPVPTPLVQRQGKRLPVVPAPTSSATSDPHPEHTYHHGKKATGSTNLTIAPPATTVLDNARTSHEDRDDTTTTTTSTSTDRSTNNVRPFHPAGSNQDSVTSQDTAERRSGPDPLITPIAFPKARGLSLPLLPLSQRSSRPCHYPALREVRSTSIDPKHSVTLDSDLQGLVDFLDGIDDFDEEDSTTVVVSDNSSLSTKDTSDPFVNMLVMDNGAAADSTLGLTATMSALSGSQFMFSYDDDGSSIDTSILRDLEYRMAHPEEVTAEDIIMPPVLARDPEEHTSVPKLSSLPVSQTLDEDSRQVPSQRSRKSYSTKHSSAIVGEQPSVINDLAVSKNKASVSSQLGDVNVRESVPSKSENLKRIPMLTSTSTISTAVTSETDQLLAGLTSLSSISTSGSDDDSKDPDEISKHSEASNNTNHSEDPDKILSYSTTGSSLASVEVANQWNDVLGKISQGIFVSSPTVNMEVTSNVVQEEQNVPTGICILDRYATVCSSLACCWKDCLQVSKVSDIPEEPVDYEVTTNDLQDLHANEPRKVEAVSIHGHELACVYGDDCTSFDDGSETDRIKHPTKTGAAAVGKTMATLQATTDAALIMACADLQREMSIATQVDTVISMDQEALADYMDLRKDLHTCYKLISPNPKDPFCLCNDRVNQVLDRGVVKPKGCIMRGAYSLLSETSRSLNSLSATPEGFGEGRRFRADSVPTLLSSSTIMPVEACDDCPPFPPPSPPPSPLPPCPAAPVVSAKRRGFLGIGRHFALLRRSKSKGSVAKTM